MRPRALHVGLPGPDKSSRMTYDYEAKGREDFAAGKRDDRLYEATQPNGESYRKGWQSARRGSETPTKAPEPGKPQENSAPAPSQPTPPSAEDLKLATGEKKPRRPKPVHDDQLSFL